jgi:hypothetical protein
MFNIILAVILIPINFFLSVGVIGPWLISDDSYFMMALGYVLLVTSGLFSGYLGFEAYYSLRKILDDLP